MYGTIYVYVHICRKNVVSIQCLTRIIGDNMYIYISIQYIHPEIYYGYPKSPYYHLIIFCQTSFFDICMCYVENTQLHGVYLWDTFDLARSWLKLYKPSYQPTRPWGGGRPCRSLQPFGWKDLNNLSWKPTWPDILLVVQKSQGQPPGMHKILYLDNGISTGAGFLPSTVGYVFGFQNVWIGQNGPIVNVIP